jgi:hypothetical protein
MFAMHMLPVQISLGLLMNPINTIVQNTLISRFSDHLNYVTLSSILSMNMHVTAVQIVFGNFPLPQSTSTHEPRMDGKWSGNCFLLSSSS